MAAARLHHNHESWAQLLANEVSDDDEDQYGTLILNGEEEEEDESLHASEINVSHETLQAIVDKIAPEEDFEEEEARDEQYKSTVVEVVINRKKLVVVMASVVCVLLLSLVGVSRALRRRDAQLEALAKENQELLEKTRRLEQEKAKSCTSGWEEEEEWKVADNCYVKVGFGECTKRQWEEWNEVADSFWGYFEQAWTSSDEESSVQDDANQDPKVASFPVEAFTELSHTLTRIVGTAQDAVSQASHQVALGIMATVDEIMELSRDAVDDGTAYTRLEMQ